MSGGYVFISYKSEDSKKAYQLKNELENGGINCWMAPDSIPAGKKYADVIGKAIEECSALVLLLTKATQSSPHIESELELAFSNKTPIIVVKTETFELEPGFAYYLKSSHWVEVKKISANDNGMKSIISSIKELTKDDEDNSPETDVKETVSAMLADDFGDKEVILMEFGAETQKDYYKKSFQKKLYSPEHIELLITMIAMTFLLITVAIGTQTDKLNSIANTENASAVAHAKSLIIIMCIIIILTFLLGLHNIHTMVKIETKPQYIITNKRVLEFHHEDYLSHLIKDVNDVRCYKNDFGNHNIDLCSVSFDEKKVDTVTLYNVPNHEKVYELLKNLVETSKKTDT